jgi:hypothetical protein
VAANASAYPYRHILPADVAVATSHISPAVTLTSMPFLQLRSNLGDILSALSASYFYCSFEKSVFTPDRAGAVSSPEGAALIAEFSVAETATDVLA